MPRRWVLWALFASSYAPLFVLISIRAIGQATGLAVTTGALALVGIVATIAFLASSRERPATKLVVLQVEDRNPDIAAYAATYLLPFLPVFSGSWQDYVSLVGFIALLGVIYVRSRLVYLNPLLSLVGYRLWRVVAVTYDGKDSGPGDPQTGSPMTAAVATSRAEPTDESASTGLGARAEVVQAPWPRFLLSTEDLITVGAVISAHPLTNDLLIGELHNS